MLLPKNWERQIVPPKVGAPMSSPCGAQRAMVMQTYPNSWMNKLWDSKARQGRKKLYTSVGFRLRDVLSTVQILRQAPKNTMKQHRGMGHYQANPGPTCRCSYDVALVFSQGNLPSCIVLSDLHDVTWVLGRRSGQRAWRKRKRRPNVIFEALNHIEAAEPVFCCFFVWLFLFHPKWN